MVADVAGQGADSAPTNVVQQPVKPAGCCITCITFDNDDTEAVFYRVYRSGPHRDLAHTDPVKPGGTITVTGDFGHCVRVSAVRTSTPLDSSGNPIAGRFSAMQLSCSHAGANPSPTPSDDSRTS